MKSIRNGGVMCGDVGRKQFRSMTRRSEKGRFPRNPLPQGKRERKEGRKEGRKGGENVSG